MYTSEEYGIIRFARVESVFDDDEGLRIKARLTPEENNVSIDDIPYTFPLLPKHLHINPKVGECVLVILGVSNHIKSNRFFIGPLISQQYNIGFERYNSSKKLLNGKWEIPPLAIPSNNPKNNGTIPKREDIVIQGRDNADLILKPSEVRLRCGFKAYPGSNGSYSSLEFNREDLGYMQMRYTRQKNLDNKKIGYGSVINLVANKINLLSHDTNSQGFELNNPDYLITDATIRKINEKAHPMVYGDVLVKILRAFMKLFEKHQHPWAQKPPCFESEAVMRTLKGELNNLLCESIRLQ